MMLTARAQHGESPEATPLPERLAPLASKAVQAGARSGLSAGNTSPKMDRLICWLRGHKEVRRLDNGDACAVIMVRMPGVQCHCHWCLRCQSLVWHQTGHCDCGLAS
jgi:hypothetical protein